MQQTPEQTCTSLVLRNKVNICTGVRRQKELTLTSEIVEERDFSDTKHTLYISDVQGSIAKVLSNIFSAKIY